MVEAVAAFCSGCCSYKLVALRCNIDIVVVISLCCGFVRTGQDHPIFKRLEKRMAVDNILIPRPRQFRNEETVGQTTDDFRKAAKEFVISILAVWKMKDIGW